MAFRDIVTKDLSWKLFSLALAAVIWLTVRPGSKDAVKGGNPLAVWDVRSFTNLPVVVLSSAADVHEFRVKPEVVEVMVGGRPQIISALTEKEIRVIVDLTEIESARALRKRVDVTTPPGVTFIRAWPAQVDVVVPPPRAN